VNIHAVVENEPIIKVTVCNYTSVTIQKSKIFLSILVIKAPRKKSLKEELK
jgi:mevalonate kinase